MTPGLAEIVRIQLDECGHRFLPGHRVRLAISTAYWPLILPTPTRVTATIGIGAETVLTLPERKDGADCAVLEPANPDPLPQYRQITPDSNRRWISWNWRERLVDRLFRSTRARIRSGFGLGGLFVRRLDVGRLGVCRLYVRWFDLRWFGVCRLSVRRRRRWCWIGWCRIVLLGKTDQTTGRQA